VAGGGQGRDYCVGWGTGATITEIARLHDVTRQQIYAWRSELKKKGLLSVSSSAFFIPVDLNAVQNDAPN
jgi:transposase